MKLRNVDKSAGQTLVQLALLLTILLAFVAFAVDFGRVYMERRRLQNAADAGALAAGRARCFGGTGGAYGTVDQALAAGRTYATSEQYNGAPEADVTTGDGWVYTVSTTKHVQTTFASVVGLPEVTVHAVAAAKCGGATSACGLWPITLSEGLWDQLYEAACLDPGNPKPIYVWAGWHSGKTHCDDPLDPECCVVDPSDPSGPCTGICTDRNCKDPNCGVDYDCDTDNDGIQNVFTDQGRAWLDFSLFGDPNTPNPGNCPKTGCGTSELGYCMADSSNIKISLPACMSGSLGVRGGVKQEVLARAGDVVGIPVFGSFCPNPGSCNGGYMITDFGCVRIVEENPPKRKPWYHLKLPRLNNDVPQTWQGWVIQAEVFCDGCNTFCGGTNDPAPTPEPGGMRAVSLIQ